MNDIFELALWGTYFSVGFFLLFILIWARQTMKKVYARKKEADRLVARTKKDTSGSWTRNRRVI